MTRTNIIPERDASLGLIYRLNGLWAQVDYFVLKGYFSKWNNVLDRIYINLQFRNPMIKISDEKTGKIKYTMPMKDVKVYKYFSVSIENVRQKYVKTHNKVLKRKIRSTLYHLLQNKDAWLRKLMQDLRLYLKESEKRPGGAVYGTFKGGGR